MKKIYEYRKMWKEYRKNYKNIYSFKDSDNLSTVFNRVKFTIPIHYFSMFDSFIIFVCRNL